MGKIGMYGGKFLPLHQGHLSVIVKAMNQVDKLYVVLTSSPRADKELCKRDGCKYMDGDLRASWLGKELAPFENIELIHVRSNESYDSYDWEDGSEMIKKKIPEDITHVFSSEPSYTPIFEHLYPFAEHVIVDQDRTEVPICATFIRLDAHKYWEFLPESVRPFFVKKILVSGTESCGKTTLVKQLAKTMNTNYVLETGRKYCEDSRNNLTKKDFDLIAMQNHLEIEEALKHSNKYLIIDSDALITAFYLDMYFDTCSIIIDELAELQEFDLILHCTPDVRWVDDGIRFNSSNEVRKTLDKDLRKFYNNFDREYSVITGTYEERYKKSIDLVRGTK